MRPTAFALLGRLRGEQRQELKNACSNHPMPVNNPPFSHLQTTSDSLRGVCEQAFSFLLRCHQLNEAMFPLHIPLSGVFFA
jgi:hypothetical protein